MRTIDPRRLDRMVTTDSGSIKLELERDRHVGGPESCAHRRLDNENNYNSNSSFGITRDWDAAIKLLEGDR